MKTWQSATKSVLSIAVDVYKHFDSVGKTEEAVGKSLALRGKFQRKFNMFSFSSRLRFSPIGKTLESNLLRFYYFFFSHQSNAPELTLSLKTREEK